MTTILDCPQCRGLMLLPPEAVPTAWLECPLCQARFALAHAAMHPAPVARLAAPPAPTLAVDSAPQPSETWQDLADIDIEALTVTTAGEDTVRIADDRLSAERRPEPAPTLGHEAAVGGFEVIGDFDGHYDQDDPQGVSLDHDRTDARDDYAAAVVGVPAHATADAEDDDDGEFDADERVGLREAEFDLRPAVRAPRRRTSPVGMLVGVVGGGVFGLLLAGYALLWLRGAQADWFHMSAWLPPSLLPPSMHIAHDNSSAADDELAERDPTADDASEVSANNTVEGEVADSQSESEPDSGVVLASASEPAEAPDADAADPAEPADPQSAPEDEALEASPRPVFVAPPAERWPSSAVVSALVAPKFVPVSALIDATTAGANAGREFVTGDLANPDTVREMGRAYVQLCGIAEALTMTDPQEYGTALFTKQAVAKTPLQIAAGAAARRQDLAVVAARWWKYAGRTNRGILLVGHVRELRPEGRWTEALVELPVPSAEKVLVPVLLERMKVTTGAEVAVAGVIVSDPQQHISAYSGAAAQVVVEGYVFDPRQYAEMADEESPEFDIGL